MSRTALLAVEVVAALVGTLPLASCSAQERVAADAAQPATTQPATTQPQVGRFPFIEVDLAGKQIRVACEALRVENPLEFFACVAGTVEHESVLRSRAKPSHLHAALLMLGLEPGEPVRYSPAADKWLPPHGPPLQITVQFEHDGAPVAVPAYRLMRDFKTKREMRPMTWIFAGARVSGDVYTADRSGHLVGIVNFEDNVIDVPQLASNANEALNWQANLELLPAKGTAVTMIIEPAGGAGRGGGGEGAGAAAATTRPADQGAAAAAGQAAAPIDVALIRIDADGKIDFEGRAVASPDDLAALLKRENGAHRQARVAVANPIEQNAAARRVMNVLSLHGVRFTMIPQATAGAAPPPQPRAGAGAGANAGDVRADDALIGRLRARWNQAVAPHDAQLREASKTHYDVIAELRREQQRLIDEADKVQRLIDELDKQYQDMTTPKPQ